MSQNEAGQDSSRRCRRYPNLVALNPPTLRRSRTKSNHSLLDNKNKNKGRSNNTRLNIYANQRIKRREKSQKISRAQSFYQHAFDKVFLRHPSDILRLKPVRRIKTNRNERYSNVEESFQESRDWNTIQTPPEEQTYYNGKESPFSHLVEPSLQEYLNHSEIEPTVYDKSPLKLRFIQRVKASSKRLSEIEPEPGVKPLQRVDSNRTPRILANQPSFQRQIMPAPPKITSNRKLTRQIGRKLRQPMGKLQCNLVMENLTKRDIEKVTQRARNAKMQLFKYCQSFITVVTMTPLYEWEPRQSDETTFQHFLYQRKGIKSHVSQLQLTAFDYIKNYLQNWMQIGSFIRVVGGFYLPNNICDENLLTTTIFDVNFELLQIENVQWPNLEGIDNRDLLFECMRSTAYNPQVEKYLFPVKDRNTKESLQYTATVLYSLNVLNIPQLSNQDITMAQKLRDLDQKIKELHIPQIELKNLQNPDSDDILDFKILFNALVSNKI